MHIIKELYEEKVIKCPKFLPDNTMYLAYTGSVSYGCSQDYSDNDLVGWCIPPREIVFPHTVGRIEGFGVRNDKFNDFEAHGLKYKEKNYDIRIFNVVQYFNLCLQNNPNCLDYLFTDRGDILHTTQVGELVRENRSIFLHKGLWPRFKGYAYSQLKKLGREKYVGKRVELVEKYGYDTKNAYQCVRLLLEAEQLLAEKNMDLKRHKEQLISVRTGEYTLDELKNWCAHKESNLEQLYHESDLPWSASDVESKVRDLLLNVLEHHYGSLKNIVERVDKYKEMVLRIKEIVNEESHLTGCTVDGLLPVR